jgi:CheY-like chemotaxis protein
MMERQVNHMVRLVDDLMEVTRITRGLVELRKQVTELATVVRSAIETSNPVIEAKQHQLAVSLPPETIPLHGDEIRLEQIFANLLNNAAKYTDPHGQIWLTAKVEADEVVVTVRDNGIGLSPESQPLVFEMFMQADRSTTRSQGGLGIGLTLVKNLVELHGGTITVHSGGKGQGSEFIVRLPIMMEPIASPRSPVPSSQRKNVLPQRVLVVDDNQDSASSLAMLLKFLGTEIRVANDGPTALEVIKDFRPNIVLLDIGMPGMDGFAVARRVREDHESDGMVLIALTGWGQAEDRERTREAGFDHHLVKPADIATLKSLLASPKDG